MIGRIVSTFKGLWNMKKPCLLLILVIGRSKRFIRLSDYFASKFEFKTFSRPTFGVKVIDEIIGFKLIEHLLNSGFCAY